MPLYAAPFFAARSRDDILFCQPFRAAMLALLLQMLIITPLRVILLCRFFFVIF